MKKPSILVMIVFAAAASLSSATTPAAQETPKIDWVSDLKFFQAEFPKAHVDPFHSLKREEFLRMVSELVSRAPRSTDRQMVAGLMRITSAIGDSHSGIHFTPGKLRFENVSLNFYVFGDNLGIISGSPGLAELVGGTVVSINGHRAREIVQHMKLLTEGTNDMTRSAFVVPKLVRPELLFFEGFATRPDQYDVVVQKDGQTIKRSLHTLGRKADGSPVSGGLTIGLLPPRDSGWTSAAPAQLPLWLQDQNKNFWWKELPERSTLYIQDRLVQDQDGGQRFADFFQEVFRKIEQQHYKTIVLDLRLNGGGDNTLFAPLKEGFKSMPEFQTKGRFFVIIGRLTQSAAQNFTTFLERNTKATFVGEGTGESPNHVGDAAPIDLPSSGISINLSRKHWNDSDSDDHRLWTAPEISAPLTLDAFRKGQDPALEAIWNTVKE